MAVTNVGMKKGQTFPKSQNGQNEQIVNSNNRKFRVAKNYPKKADNEAKEAS